MSTAHQFAEEPVADGDEARTDIEPTPDPLALDPLSPIPVELRLLQQHQEETS